MAAAAAAGLVLVVLVILAVMAATSARPVASTGAPASKSPVPTQLGTWRVQGTITDTAVEPLEGVCIGVGPAVCTPTNPRTDAQGRWFIDFPAVPVDYEMHFTKEGYKPVSVRVTLTGPQVVGVVLER
jgi:hypothetical protein